MSTTEPNIADALAQAREVLAKAENDGKHMPVRLRKKLNADPNGPVDILLKKVPREMVDWLEAERARRGLRSRDATIRAILGEAQEKP